MTQVSDAAARGASASPDSDLLDRCAAADLKEALCLTGDIYDCALDPGRWPETLRKISGFVGAAASCLTSLALRSRKGGFHFSWGDDPRCAKLYLDEYVKRNALLMPMMLLEAGEVRSLSSVMSTDTFRTTRFYREWARRAGYGDNTAAIIEKSTSAVTLLTASHRPCDSPVDGKPRRRMQLLVPHVRRALAIGKVIEMHRTHADALADTVDALSAGIFLMCDAGCMVRANAAARAMLAAGDMLFLQDGALAVRCGGARRHALVAAIASAVRDDPVSPHGVGIPLVAGNGNRYVAHVLPLTSGTRRNAGRTSAAGAAVFVHKAELGGLLPLEAIARQFGLSPAELRVLAVVMKIGGSVTDIAEMLGLAAPTVKTHLRRLFEKTDTKCRTELVRLVARYVNPLVSQHQATR